LKDIPDGLQLWKDSNDNETFDPTDERLQTSTSTYSTSNTVIYYNLMSLLSPNEIATDDVYFFAIQPDQYGVVNGQSAAIGIAANGITTTSTTISSDEVNIGVTMEASSPKIVRIVADGDISTEGTHLNFYFDQPMNTTYSSWADPELDGSYIADFLFSVSDPDTYVGKTYGTSSTAAFGTNVVENDMITVTLGNGATIADGDKIWVNFPSTAGNWP